VSKAQTVTCNFVAGSHVMTVSMTLYDRFTRYAHTGCMSAVLLPTGLL